MYLYSCMYAVIKGLSIYQHVTKFRCLIQGMPINVQNITEWRCLIYGLRNTELENTEYYEMIYKLIKSPTFCNILIYFVY